MARRINPYYYANIVAESSYPDGQTAGTSARIGRGWTVTVLPACANVVLEAAEATRSVDTAGGSNVLRARVVNAGQRP